MLIMKIPFISLLKHKHHSDAGYVVIPSANGVYCVQIEQAAGRPRVKTFAYHQLPGMQSSGVTSAALEKIHKKMGLGNFQFSTLLAPGDYQLLQIEAPNVPDEEIKSAVRWSIKDSLSFSVDDASIDVLVIPTAPGIGERKKSLYVVAAANAVIKKRTDLFQRANMDLQVIDIPEMAQRNIAALYEKEGRTLALLAFDESGGLLTFTSSGELFMARRIEISTGQLQDADESTRQQYLDRLELEVQRSLDYFDRQFNYASVNRLLVSVPSQSGLIEKLAENLSVPVERLDLSQVMDLGKEPELEDGDMQVYALHALGAALRIERQEQ
jgi:MSHA biogenesis protein MshI